MQKTLDQCETGCALLTVYAIFLKVTRGGNQIVGTPEAISRTPSASNPAPATAR
jgi:hypothetical protein